MGLAFRAQLENGNFVIRKAGIHRKVVLVMQPFRVPHLLQSNVKQVFYTSHFLVSQLAITPRHRQKALPSERFVVQTGKHSPELQIVVAIGDVHDPFVDKGYLYV